MLKALLRRLRQFMGAELMAGLDRLKPELQAARAETAALRGELATLRGELAALRDELAARDARENALAKQMEAAFLAIALNRRDERATSS